MFYQQQLHIPTSLKKNHEQQVAQLANERKTLEQLLETTDQPLQAIIDSFESPTTLDVIEKTASEIRARYKKLIILGMGGATLCPQTLVGTSISNIAIEFIDYIDPVKFHYFLDQLIFEETCFLVISKSGNTIETLAQTGAILQKMNANAYTDISSSFLFITEEKPSPIRTLAETLNAKTLPHSNVIGGRYSIFTTVGLLPAAVAGMDIAAILEGAKFLWQNHKATMIDSVITNFSLCQSAGLRMNVMMPYIEALSPFATWFRQLWAESLGKGQKGLLPIKAVGTLDQHSQLQLYLDGPKDKFFTLITANYKQKGPLCDVEKFGLNDCNYLNHKKIGDIMDAAATATIDSLIENQCPLRHISIESCDEKTIGALALQMMLETILMAKLLEVNPYDQPAVEAGKRSAKAMLQG